MPCSGGGSSFAHSHRTAVPVFRVMLLDVLIDVGFKGCGVFDSLWDRPQVSVQQLPQDYIFVGIFFKAEIAAIPGTAFPSGGR